MRARHPNRRPQGCSECRDLVQPYDGVLYAHTKENPPPTGAIVSRGGTKRKPVWWLVRCRPCDEIRRARESAERLEEIYPEHQGPWWRDA